MKFFIALMLTNLKASIALRTAFWLQSGFMLLNNLLYFTIWWILFERFDQIRGFEIGDMAALYGIAAGGYGFASILAGSLPELGKRIESGDLDPFLTQPRSVLVQSISGRMRPDGWGDVLTAIILFALSGHVDLATIPVAIWAITISTAVFISAGILLQSITFFVERFGGLARQMYEFMLSFATFPPTLFSGTLKVLLFTVLPAGLITYLPVELLREFSLGKLVIATVAAGTHFAFAVWVFHRGLRAYRSGNRFGVRV